MRNAIAIARREFLERVRTWWFVAVTLLGPVGMIAILVIPAWLAAKNAEEGFEIEVVDRTGRDLAAALSTEVETAGVRFELRAVDPEVAEATLLERIRDKEIDGFLLLPKDLFSGGDAIYKGDNATDMALNSVLEELVRFAVVRAKASTLGISELDVLDLMARVNVDAQQTTGTAETRSGRASFIVGYAVMFILYMAILLYAVNVLRSVVMEKSNRVIEIIVSSVKPTQLMLGKVVGVAAVGLLQLSIWALMAVLMFRFREQILGFFGVHGAGAIQVPSLGLLSFALALLYFLLGFLFYASLYAAIGAMVNSEQEAQQAQTPLVILLIIPAACVQLVAGDPRGTVSQVLTQIPFSSPILMPMRYLLDAASPAEVSLSLAILVASTALAVVAAAKIYRVGILMHGKRPSLAEIWRWLRA